MSDDKKTTNEPAEPESPAAEEVTRGRPGKRSVEDKRQAVLDILSGKATVAQVAKRLCVLPETVEGWKQDALAAMEGAFRQGPAQSDEDKKLAVENAQLKRVVVNGRRQLQAPLNDNYISPSTSLLPCFAFVVVVGSVVVDGVSFLACSASSARMLGPVISRMTA